MQELARISKGSRMRLGENYKVRMQVSEGPKFHESVAARGNAMTSWLSIRLRPRISPEDLGSSDITD